MMSPVVSNPATRVIDECVDPGTRHIVLRYHDGVVEVTRLRATSFRLPRLIGRTRAEVYAMGGRPIQSFEPRGVELSCRRHGAEDPAAYPPRRAEAVRSHLSRQHWRPAP